RISPSLGSATAAVSIRRSDYLTRPSGYSAMTILFATRSPMCSPSLIDRGKPASAAPCQRLPPALAGLRTLFAFEPRLAPFAERALPFLEIFAGASPAQASCQLGHR